jgi:hypothetical protein
MVGTLRGNVKGIPQFLKTTKLELHDSAFIFNCTHQSLAVKYKCKQKKDVMLLSTMHENPHVDNTEKRKPLLIHFYNHHKCGVDAADSMLRLYTSRCATRRWPVSVWHNLLDMSVLNAWICYKQAKKSKISRKKFILNLIVQLTGTTIAPDDAVDQGHLLSRKRKCQIVMCKNQTKTQCRVCNMSLCGTHCENPVEKISLTICGACNH